MDIKVHIRNYNRATTRTYSDSTTIREVIVDMEIDCSVGTMTLDGNPVRPEDFDKSFKDFGISEDCYLYNVCKMKGYDNGTYTIE